MVAISILVVSIIGSYYMQHLLIIVVKQIAVGLVHPNMKIISSFTHRHVVPNP